MENQIVSDEQMCRNIEKSHRRGKVAGGLLVIAAGSLFLAKELGADIPVWMFTWKMLLIAIGVVLAIKHKFMHPGWIVLVAIGGTFLLTDLYPDMQIRPYLWPVLLILLGLFMVFKPRRRFNPKAEYWKKWHHHRHHQMHHGMHGYTKHHRHDWTGAATDETPDGDYLNSVSFMAGVKKNILSKKFRGGDVVNIFCGAQIDLTQADFEGTATLEVTQIFGGTRLLVPANWEVKSETVTFCGGIEDKRPLPQVGTADTKKVLMLVGTTVFGGIEIKSY